MLLAWQETKPTGNYLGLRGWRIRLEGWEPQGSGEPKEPTEPIRFIGGIRLDTLPGMRYKPFWTFAKAKGERFGEHSRGGDRSGGWLGMEANELQGTRRKP